MEPMFSFFKDSDFDSKIDSISGLTPELRALYISSLFDRTDKSIIFLCSTLFEANIYYQKLLNHKDNVLFFPMDDFLTSEALATSPELKITRLETLKEMCNGKHIIVTNLMGYLRFLPPINLYKDSYIRLEVGNEYPQEELIEKLYSLGYTRETIVSKTGEMAIRGYVLDIFPITSNFPVRLEFFGDEIESIREFDMDSQLTIVKKDYVEIGPNSEFLTGKNLEDMPHRKITDYVSPSHLYEYADSMLVINDYSSVREQLNILIEEMDEYRKNNEINDEFMFKYDEPSDVLYLNSFDNVSKGNTKKYESFPIDNFKGDKNFINKELEQYLKDGYTIIFFLKNRYAANRLMDYLENEHMVLTNINEIYDHKMNIVFHKLNEGFIYQKYVCISEKEIFNQKDSMIAYKTNFKLGSKVRDINKLEVGDYIVHNIHGIGMYCGIKTLVKNGLKKDYLMIEYKGGDKLYIPVEKLDFISKYSSSDGVAPKLNKLGGTEWQKTKLRVKNKIENIAGDLLRLYAERESAKGFAFLKDDEMQLEFEKEFAYQETQDQLRAIDEIKKDMEKPHPMDRLLCGDVGYGKTEVAFRAIFKAILSGKQVALLCPTTILSNQHYHNALDRFLHFPVKVALLNRFVSPKETKKTLEDLKEGKVDLLIGTHRILSDDVEFKNLGLLIVDEEQRFGVKHKEKLKQYKNTIDVLTLSATPIPRTLQMSMTGVRSLSLIETPPSNRYPIQTYVLEENKQIIRDAVYKELSRNGQVFILYNNVEDMEEKKRELERIVPEARIICGHGQMDKIELENVMMSFLDHEYDVLLCTTIIETGIDIPSVNTLIIIDADRFGLSQLYQIRGRVGRSNKIAYCYLMYHRGKTLTDIATKRLNVIKEFTELGSGFSIAMRDLSLRGAGDILGSEQAGFIDSVGIELFLRMLHEEVERLKGNEEVKEEEKDTQPLLEVETTIDDSYVSEEDLKIEIHNLINEIHTEEDLNRVKEELEDRFGKLSDELMIYMNEELFESRARELGIEKIIQSKTTIEIFLPVNISTKVSGDKLFLRACSLTRKLRFGMKNKELVMTLDIHDLDKHPIYYLIDLLTIVKESIEE